MLARVLERRVVPALATLGALCVFAWAALAAPPEAAAAVDGFAGWNLDTLTETDRYMVNPVLDDGRLFWTRSTEGSGSELIARGVGGGDPVVLVADSLSPRTFAVDGDRLVFAGHDGIDSEIFLLTLSTGDLKKLTNNNWDDNRPRIAGDLVTWERLTYGPDTVRTRLLLYDISADATRELHGSPNQVGLEDPFCDGTWVVWRSYREYDSGGWNTWAYRRGAERADEILVLDSLELHALVDGALYYTRDASGRSELHALDLATGADSTVVVNDKQIQSVRAHGDLVAWASWWTGRGRTESYLSILDRSVPGGELRTIPSPGYSVGSLDLSDSLLAWVGESRARTLSVPNTYVFAYDLARDTVTRLTSTGGYAQGGGVDGSSLVFRQIHLLSREPIHLATDIVVATPEVEPGPAFKDVPGLHPYRTPVVCLAERGVVSGYPALGGGSDFRPDASLTRAQFCKMLAEALDVEVSEDFVASFSDLGADDPGSLFPHDYIAALTAQGIIKGTGGGRFSPYSTLTRAQLVTLVARATEKLRPGLLVQYPQYEEWVWTTLGNFDPVHARPMRQAEWSGLLDGLVGFSSTWDPWMPATRGEAAQLLWNVASID